MDHYEREGKKREAMRKLRAQQRRTGDLRLRVVTTSLVAFVVLWAVVFAQMATGNDPVLSAKSGAVATTTSSRQQKARAARSEAGAGTDAETSSEAIEAEPAETEAAETEAEAFALEAETIEAELAEFEAESTVEAEPEIEEFVEEPAPVTTSQS